jgi:Skp family chaperone for outer membrane proteins
MSLTPLSRLRLAAAVAVLTLMGLIHPVRAQSGPMVIAVVDLQVIQHDSKGATSARAAIDKQTKAFEADLAKQQTALQAEGQQLEQQRASMAPADFQKKAEAFQKKLSSLRDTATKRRQQLQQMEANAQSKLSAAFSATVADIAKARNISLVLIKGAVAYNLPAFDITAEVLQKLDVRLPSVNPSATQ